MPHVHIVTDSSAQFLNPAMVRDLGIVIVPLEIHLGGRTYREGIDLDADQYFRRMHSYRGDLPSLSAPPAESIADIYMRLCRDGASVISLHLSRAVHPMFHQAQIARNSILGRCDIDVVDSQMTSVGLGIMVEEAARLAHQGIAASDIIRTIRKLIPRLYTMFFTETLEYLRRGGLLSESQAILGTMLGIKPFVIIEEGDLQAVEKVRTRAQAVDELVRFACEFEDVERACILYSGSTAGDVLRTLEARLKEDAGGWAYPKLMYHPSLACLLGPDALGIVIYEREHESVPDDDPLDKNES